MKIDIKMPDFDKLDPSLSITCPKCKEKIKTTLKAIKEKTLKKCPHCNVAFNFK